MLVMSEDMTREDLFDFGWDEHSINSGVIADADFFVFFTEDEVPYSFMRHYKGAYELVHGVTFRGVHYGSALCAWCN